VGWVAADEARHDDARGIESWGFAFAGSEATGQIRLTLDVAHAQASYVVDLRLARLGRVVVADETVPVPRPTAGLEIRTDGLWASLYCETAFEHWTLGLEAFGLRVGADAAAPSWDALVGDRVPVGFDLEWELTAAPEPLADGNGYRQVGTLVGQVLVERDRLDLESTAERDHWWGMAREQAPRG
jgi:hypothetical protein